MECRAPEDPLSGFQTSNWEVLGSWDTVGQGVSLRTRFDSQLPDTQTVQAKKAYGLKTQSTDKTPRNTVTDHSPISGARAELGVSGKIKVTFGDLSFLFSSHMSILPLPSWECGVDESEGMLPTRATEGIVLTSISDKLHTNLPSEFQVGKLIARAKGA